MGKPEKGLCFCFCSFRMKRLEGKGPVHREGDWDRKGRGWTCLIKFSAWWAGGEGGERRGGEGRGWEERGKRGRAGQG